MANITFTAFNAYGVGGTVRFVASTANYLASQGHEVVILSVYKNKDKPVFYFRPQVKIVHLVDRKKVTFFQTLMMKFSSKIDDPLTETFSSYNLLTDWLLFLFFFKLKTDFLICSNTYFLNASLLPHLHKRKIIAQEHLGYEIHPNEYRPTLLSLLSKSDFVHCVNKRDMKTYRKILPDTVTVKTIYNNIIHQKSISALQNKEIISTGRLVYQKNYQFLLEAFSRFLVTHPDWKLKIFGNGDEHESLISLTKKLNLGSRVMIIPAVANIRSHLLNASVYVCSSRYESFCLSLLEAMECGLACISTECDGPSEIIEHGRSGILVPQENIQRLVDAMTVTADYPNRVRLGINARIRSMQFSTNRIGSEWDNLLTKE